MYLNLHRDIFNCEDSIPPVKLEFIELTLTQVKHFVKLCCVCDQQQHEDQQTELSPLSEKHVFELFSDLQITALYDLFPFMKEPWTGIPLYYSSLGLKLSNCRDEPLEINEKSDSVYPAILYLTIETRLLAAA